MTRAASRTIVLLLALSGVASACSGDPDGCDHRVSPGGDDVASIQGMFDVAAAGDTLCFAPGIYQLDAGLEVRRRAGLTIRGLGALPEDVVLDFVGMSSASRAIDASADRLVMESFEVRSPLSTGIFVGEANDVTLRDLRVIARADPMDGSGIEVVQATRIVIESSEIRGANLGIRFEAVERCVISDTVVTQASIGITLDGSADCLLIGNTVTHTTTGIWALHQVGRTPLGARLLIRSNTIAESDGVDSAYFPGVGLALLATDDVEVWDNDVHDNPTAGILVGSYELILPSSGAADETFYPDRVWIHDNTWSANGGAPRPSFEMVGPTLEDVLWDGALAVSHTDASDVLCLDDDEGSYRMMSVRDRFVSQSTDRTPVDCQGAAVSPAFD